MTPLPDPLLLDCPEVSVVISPIATDRRRFFGRWVLATGLAWPVGLIVAIVVAQLVNLVYARETNLVVGLCLGAVIGVAQCQAARESRVYICNRWILATALGMGIPFVAEVLWTEIGGGATMLTDSVLSRALGGLVGGALVGLLQLRAIRLLSPRASWWVLSSAVAWCVAWASTAVGAVAGVLLGGVLLGTISGSTFLWLPRHALKARTAEA